MYHLQMVYINMTKSAKNIYGFAECTNKAENNNITQWDQVSK